MLPPTPPPPQTPNTRFAPLRRLSQPLFATDATEPAGPAGPAQPPPPEPERVTLPSPEETRPDGTGDVVEDAPEQPEPWVRTPTPLFSAPASRRTAPAPVSAPITTAAQDGTPEPEQGPPPLPFYRRQAPAPAPAPREENPAKPAKLSVLSKFALWSEAPAPLFRKPGEAGSAVATISQPQTMLPPAPTLVTGATGFVGSAVARALAAEGYTLRLLVRPGSDRRNLEGLQAEIAEGDLTDHASLAAALAGCRYLVHVAADYRLWVPRPEAMQATNVDGTRALMQAAQAAGVERIVYCSSVATLGLEDDGSPGTEDTPVYREAIVGAYKNSKFEAEQVVRAMAAAGLPVVIVNPSAPVGRGTASPRPRAR